MRMALERHPGLGGPLRAGPRGGPGSRETGPDKLAQGGGSLDYRPCWARRSKRYSGETRAALPPTGSTSHGQRRGQMTSRRFSGFRKPRSLPTESGARPGCPPAHTPCWVLSQWLPRPTSGDSGHPRGVQSLCRSRPACLPPAAPIQGQCSWASTSSGKALGGLRPPLRVGPGPDAHTWVFGDPSPRGVPGSQGPAFPG